MDKYSPITVARFWSKVDVNKRASCWEWRGAVRGGYGNIKIGGVCHPSNRVAYEIANGGQLGEKMALHKCDNKLCCNPSHIYAGDASRNMQDIHNRSLRQANKLTPQEVVEIRYWASMGHKHAWLARHYGVNKAQISKIVRRESWAFVPESDWKPLPGQTHP